MSDELKQIEDDIAELKANQKEFSKKQAINENTLTNLAADIKAHFKDEKNFEDTLRNIDDTVNSIQLKLVDDKFTSYKSRQLELSPVYELIRESKSDFSDFKTNAQVEYNKIGEKVERRIHYQASALITISATLLFLIYTGITDKIDTNKKDVTKYIDNFNSARVNSNP